jgi:hypothetical protein
VSYLSAKNSQLEDQVKSLPDIQESLITTRKRVDLLLVMLGEKEEELEAAVGDMKEVKYLYRSQLDDLLMAAAATTPPKEDQVAGSTQASLSVVRSDDHVNISLGGESTQTTTVYVAK